ncbi:MAG: AAA family ATPase [Candidatus Diapherotrites archaeon]|nr:AAA family ATPase [Candidatus Diapherotrites archaeon]
MIVIVSGFPGSGKSTLVEKLAAEFSLKPVFASGILKQIKEREKADFASAEKGEGFWESKEGKAFTKKREKELGFDLKLDTELLRIADSSDNLIFDSRTLPWLYNGKAFKVWLKASLETCAKRIAGRDQKQAKEILAGLKERFEADKRIYKNLYKFDLGKDFEPFDLVLDTEKLDAEQVFEKVKDEIRKQHA